MYINKEISDIKKPKKKLVEEDNDVVITKENVNDYNKNITTNDITEKKKISGRTSKNDLYKDEQLDILNKLNNITGINNDKGFFYLDDISNEQQKNISDLETNIKKFFPFKVWGCIDENEKKWLSLLKNVYKGSNFVVRQSTESKMKNGIVTKKIRIIVEKQK